MAAGCIIAPSYCSDGEWWRRADAGERDASARIFPQKNIERVFEPLLFEDLTSTGVAVLNRLCLIKTSKSSANSW